MWRFSRGCAVTPLVTWLQQWVALTLTTAALDTAALTTAALTTAGLTTAGLLCDGPARGRGIEWPRRWVSVEPAKLHGSRLPVDDSA